MLHQLNSASTRPGKLSALTTTNSHDQNPTEAVQLPTQTKREAYRKAQHDTRLRATPGPPGPSHLIVLAAARHVIPDAHMMPVLLDFRPALAGRPTGDVSMAGIVVSSSHGRLFCSCFGLQCAQSMRDCATAISATWPNTSRRAGVSRCTCREATNSQACCGL